MKPNDNLILSSAEPTGINRKKVWMQKGKNLYNDKNKISGWITSDGSTGSSTATNRTGKIKIKANATYIFSYDYSSLASTDARSYCIYDNDFNVVSSSNLTYDITTKQHTFSSTKDGYIDIGYDVNCTNIMFEQNSEKTSYEAYIEPKIYVLNNNGVYEQFLEKEEEEILYEGEKGNIDDVISLNNNSQNYKALIIEGKDGGAIFDSVRIDNANGKKGSLSTITLNEDGSYYFSIQFTIKDDQITVIANYTAVNRSNGYSRYGTNDMKITKVIGIK